MGEPTSPPPAPTTDHTEWVWIGGQWVDQEKPPPPALVETPRPADTTTTTWDRTVEKRGGVPTVVWVERQWTSDELAAQRAAADWAAARVAVRSIITDLQAEKTRVEPVIAKTNAAITGGDTKDVARAARRIADAVIDLTRFVGGA